MGSFSRSGLRQVRLWLGCIVAVFLLMIPAPRSESQESSLTEVLQSLETSLATLEQGFTLVNSGLSELKEQHTQLSADLGTLETASTELERRQDDLETSWSEQKVATDALAAEISNLEAELWIYRGGLAVLAGLVVWALIK